MEAWTTPCVPIVHGNSAEDMQTLSAGDITFILNKLEVVI